MAGSGAAARAGILIRDAEALEHARHIDTVALDKTGTLTEGHPVVTEILLARRRWNSPSPEGGGWGGGVGRCALPTNPSPTPSLKGRGGLLLPAPDGK